jgi:uncharacterized membrane protein
MNIISKNIIIGLLFIALDYLWISFNIDMYNKNTIKIQGKLSIIKWKQIISIILVYILLIVSIIHIAIPFTLNNISKEDNIIEKLYKSIIYGGSIGLSIYGTYNLTSIIIYEKYSIKIAIVDTLWGLFLYTILTFIYLNL